MSVRILGTALAVLAVGAPAAHAAWSDATTIAGSSPFGEVRLAAAASGAAVAVWGELTTTPRERGRLRLAMRPSGGVFGAARTVSGAGQDVRAVGVGAAFTGALAVAWRDGVDPARARILVARGHAGGSLGAARTLPDAGTLPRAGYVGATSHPSDPAVAVADDGTVLVAWLVRARPGCGYVVVAATVPPRSAPGRAVRLGPSCPHATSLRAAVDRSGNGVIAWRGGARCNYGTPCSYGIVAAPVVHGRPRAAIAVSRGPAAANGLAVAAGAGRALVAWRDAARTTRPVTVGRVLVARVTARHALAPWAVSAADRIAGAPALAVGSDGAAVTAWQAITQLNRPTPVEVATSVFGKPFASPSTLPDPAAGTGYAGGPSAVITPGGTTMVAWQSAAHGMVATQRGADGTWATPEQLPAGNERAILAAGAPGEVLALWQQRHAQARTTTLAWSAHTG